MQPKKPLQPGLRPARLIQDIAPPGGRRDRVLRAAAQPVRQFHEATQLSHIPASRAVRRVRNFDILMPRGPHPAPAPQAAQRPATAKRPHRKPAAKPSFWRRAGEFAQYPLIAAVAIGSAYSSTVGQALIGVYLVVALLARLPSRYSFGAALLLLVGVPGFQLIHQTGVAQNAAIYTYELLVAGTLQAIVEAWLAGHQARRSAKSPANKASA